MTKSKRMRIRGICLLGLIWGSDSARFLHADVSGPPLYNIQPLGLTGPNYQVIVNGEVYQNGYAGLPTSDGAILGGNIRFTSSNAGPVALGQDAWVYSAGAYTELALTSAAYKTAKGDIRDIHNYQKAGPLSDQNRLRLATQKPPPPNPRSFPKNVCSILNKHDLI